MRLGACCISDLGQPQEMVIESVIGSMLHSLQAELADEMFSKQFLQAFPRLSLFSVSFFSKLSKMSAVEHSFRIRNSLRITLIKGRVSCGYEPTSSGPNRVSDVSYHSGFGADQSILLAGYRNEFCHGMCELLVSD